MKIMARSDAMGRNGRACKGEGWRDEIGGFRDRATEGVNDMAEGLMIPHECRVVVGDGRKVLVLRNHGSPIAPDLRVEDVFNAPDNPATSEQGTDRPGRAMGVDARRSGMEQSDWHQLAEQRFAKEIAEMLERIRRERDVKSFVLVAPPKILAELRQDISHQVREIVVAEVAKDLTGHPVPDIQRNLTD
jgi:protein required for attachment to host cells